MKQKVCIMIALLSAVAQAALYVWRVVHLSSGMLSPRGLHGGAMPSIWQTAMLICGIVLDAFLPTSTPSSRAPMPNMWRVMPGSSAILCLRMLMDS